eukprot:175175-Chlamydomonas_euryale.AAC.5
MPLPGSPAGTYGRVALQGRGTVSPASHSAVDAWVTPFAGNAWAILVAGALRPYSSPGRGGHTLCWDAQVTLFTETHGSHSYWDAEVTLFPGTLRPHPLLGRGVYMICNAPLLRCRDSDATSDAELPEEKKVIEWRRDACWLPLARPARLQQRWAISSPHPRCAQ